MWDGRLALKYAANLSIEFVSLYVRPIGCPLYRDVPKERGLQSAEMDKWDKMAAMKVIESLQTEWEASNVVAPKERWIITILCPLLETQRRSNLRLPLYSQNELKYLSAGRCNDLLNSWF